MITRSLTPNELVDAYMARLRKALGGLPATEVNDILQELSSHVSERTQTLGGQPDSTSMARILDHLGTPEEIGKLYADDAYVAKARTTFSPTLIIRTTIRLAMTTVLGFVAFLFSIIGYGLGLSLISCSLLKPFFPNNIGLWVSSHGIELAAPNASDLGPELVGWWIIPMSLFVGVLFLVVTTLILRWALRFAPRTSRSISVSG